MDDRRRLVVLFGLLVVAFAGVVTTLNLTLYSAGGFVTAYLESLARHDVAGALATPGVDLPEGLDRDLLEPAAGARLDDIRISEVIDEGDGDRAVTAEYRLGDETGRTRFVLEPAAPRFGVFSAWRFVEAPVAAMTVSVLGADEVSANGVDVESAGPTEFAVLVPTAIVLDHDSALLEAAEVAVTATEPASASRAEVAVEANDAFETLVQDELDAFLTEDCATQTVLQPTGCPFGRSFGDRIDGEPRWSITTFPDVTLTRGDAVGEWVMPITPGTAHLVVDVVSIYDGSESTFDEDVPFSVAFRIELGDDGSVAIEAVPVVEGGQGIPLPFGD